MEPAEKSRQWEGGGAGLPPSQRVKRAPTRGFPDQAINFSTDNYER